MKYIVGIIGLIAVLAFPGSLQFWGYQIAIKKYCASYKGDYTFYRSLPNGFVIGACDNFKVQRKDGSTLEHLQAFVWGDL